MGLRFAIVVVWVCVFGGCHEIQWCGCVFWVVAMRFGGVGLGLLAWLWGVWVVAMGCGGVGLGLPTWVVVGLGLPAWVVVGLGCRRGYRGFWVGRHGCGFAGVGESFGKKKMLFKKFIRLF